MLSTFLAAFLQRLYLLVLPIYTPKAAPFECAGVQGSIQELKIISNHNKSFIVHHIGLTTLVRVLSACLGLVLERTSLRESLAAASTLCTRHVTLDLVWSGNDTLCGEGDPSW